MRKTNGKENTKKLQGVSLFESIKKVLFFFISMIDLAAALKIKNIFTVLLILVLLAQAALAAVPNTLNFNGRLTNPGGDALQGTYNFTFKIYDNSTNGTLLWDKTNMTVTTDSDGIYNMILSDINLSFSEQYYLGLTVASDSEMTPRTNLTPVPYTFRANISDSLEVTRNYAIQNLTVGNKITFAFGEIVDNIVDGFIRITGGLNVTESLIVKGGVNITNDFSINQQFNVTASSGNLATAGTVSVSGAGDSYILGDVGIGTTAPTATLQVNSSQAAGAFAVYNASGTGDYFFINGSSGNVGIGTGSPGTNLDVKSSGTITDVIKLIRSSDTNPLFKIREDSSGNAIGYLYDVNGNPDIYLNTGGIVYFKNPLNVGIGTVAPTATLEINGSDSAFKVTNVSGQTAFFVNGTTGNVGIGTTSPENSLHIKHATLPAIRFEETDESNKKWQIRGTAGNLDITEQGIGSVVTFEAGGNVGIGTSTPSEKLSVMGNVSLNNSLYVLENGNVGIGTTSPTATLQVNSSQAAGAFAVYNASGTGDYFFINGTSGRVGIGTTGPETQLDLSKNLRIGSEGRNTPTSGTGLELAYSGGWFYIEAYNYSSSSYMHVALQGNPVTMTSGNVGIGTTTPSHRLQLLGAANTGIGFDLDTAQEAIIKNVHTASTVLSLNGMGDVWINSDWNNDQSATGIYFGTDGEGSAATALMTILDDGNVGIGTTSPLSQLHVSDSSFDVDLTIGSTNTTLEHNNLIGAIHFDSRESGKPGTWTAIESYAVCTGGCGSTDVGSDLRFSIMNRTKGPLIEAMRIDHYGKVGIGTTSPGRLLHLNGTGASVPGIRIEESTYGSDFLIYAGAGNADKLSIFDEDAQLDRLVIDSSGNVGIGTTSPSEKLSVMGNVSLNNSLYVLENGNVGIGTTSPGYPLDVNGEIGITGRRFGEVSAAADELLLGGGFNEIHINGNVGIGTTAPSGKLDIAWGGYTANSASLVLGADVGDKTTRTDATVKYAKIVGPHYTNAEEQIQYLTLLSNNGANELILGGEDSAFNAVTAIEFKTGATATTLTGTSRMVIDNLGNVGIGTTSPSEKLSVMGNVSLNNSLYVLENGNVGIGTTTPGAKLDISDVKNESILRLTSTTNDGDWTLTDTFGKIEFYSKDLSGGFGAGIRAKIEAVSEVAGATAGDEAGLSFWTADGGVTENIERMRIDQDGNVGIGTTSPDYELEINNSGSETVLGVTADSNQPAQIILAAGSDTTTLSQNADDGDFQIARLGTGGPDLKIQNDGDVILGLYGNVGINQTSPSYLLEVRGSAGKPGGGTWADSSDERLKKNIKESKGALERITSIKGKEWEWINPEEHAAVGKGFVADELEEVYPEAIVNVRPKGKDTELVKNETVKAFFLPNSFFADMVDAIGELNSKVEELAAGNITIVKTIIINQTASQMPVLNTTINQSEINQSLINATQPLNITMPALNQTAITEMQLEITELKNIVTEQGMQIKELQAMMQKANGSVIVRLGQE